MTSEKLIECVRKQRCLYDKRDSSYKKVSVKAQLWEDIGIEINESGEIARKKWKGLRDNYVRYKKENVGNPGETTKKFEKWPWATHLQFLDDTLAERERTSNVTGYSTHAELPLETLLKTSPPEHTPKSTAMTSTSVSNEPTFERVFTFPPNQHPHARAKKRKLDSTSGDLDRIFDYLKNKKKIQSDATDNLFKSYAQTLKKMSLKNQMFAKVRLAKLFAEVELKDAQEKSHSVTYSGESSNSDT